MGKGKTWEDRERRAVGAHDERLPNNQLKNKQASKRNPETSPSQESRVQKLAGNSQCVCFLNLASGPLLKAKAGRRSSSSEASEGCSSWASVCASVCSGAYACVYMCTWTPEDDLSCHSSAAVHPVCVWETGSLTCQAGQAGWPESSRDPPASTFSALGL